MCRKAYTVLIVVLVLLIIVVLVAMGYICRLLLLSPETGENPVIPIATTESPRLLTSEDFEPDRSVLFGYPTGMLIDPQGNEITLESLRGQNTVLIFWSSWCGDCKEYLAGSFAEAAQAARNMGAAVYLICREGIHGDNTEAAEAALGQLGLTEPAFVDRDATLYQALGLHWVPSVAILDVDGQLIYTGKGGPDETELVNLLNYVNDPNAQTLTFLQETLMMPAGMVASNYQVEEGVIVPGDTVLSESQGLLMLWAVQTGNQECFDRVWRAVRDGMTVKALTAWRLENGKKADVNASLDDLRIIEALAMADARWGFYGYEAKERARILYERCVRDGLMRDFASLRGKTTADTVTLCYMDATAMRAAASYDPRWERTAEEAEELLSRPDSLISDALPLYHTHYDVKKKKFTGDTVQMNEACIAVLNAVRAGVAFPQTLDWLEKTLAEGPVYGRYGSDGMVLPGYQFESNATYSLLVQIGVAAGRERMSQLALERMERKRCFDEPMLGGYGVLNEEEHFVFDELEAMLAWSSVKSKE